MPIQAACPTSFHMRFATLRQMSAAQPVPRSSLPPPPLPRPGARWAILLDVDGTLLDLADDAQAVVVSAELLHLLHALHQAVGGALALVSERGVDDLDRLLGHRRWAVAGLHGIELRHADGSFRRRNPASGAQTRMRDAVVALATRFDGVEVEDKHAAIALHCRHHPERLAALHDAARALIPQMRGYELQSGHQVLEFKPADMDKGRAVNELLARAPFLGHLPVYLGDDLADEHAFDSINRARGLSVRVGTREPTRANHSLASPAATQDWLQHVLHAVVHGAPADVRLPSGNPSVQP
jgi:trehalose 6-phosphate phosphatase